MTNSKREWKLFAKYLNSDLNASEKFWGLEKRIRQDKKTPGVRLWLDKADMKWAIARLLQDGVIAMDDLDEFSEEAKEKVKLISGRQYADKNRSII